MYRVTNLFLLLAISSLAVACCCSRQGGFSVPSSLSSSVHSFHPMNKTAVIIHGLNTNPEVMHDIEDVFIQKKYTVVKVILPGHGESQEVSDPGSAWETTTLNGIRQGRALADRSELVVVGYSLGGALAVLASIHPSAPKIDRMVLIAPAVRIRIPLSLLRIGTIPLLNEIPIPSIAPRHLRKWCAIPLEWYGAMTKVIEQIDAYQESEKFRNIPTTILLNPRDEVISISKTEDWLKLHSLNNAWAVKMISIAPSPSEHFQHNLVERSSVGEQAWSELVEVLIEEKSKTASWDLRMK